jgi:D-alanyl-D-alanine carboxypeptidase/D-alanyl-D-alanine-endopeptidase (penicillin-binding protein 4)
MRLRNSARCGVGLRPRLAGLKACATLVLIATAACAAHPAPPARPAPPAPDAAALVQLQHDIDTILAQPALEHGYWGVLVRSLKANDTLYALNARKLMMPASNMKIVTLAAAAEKLGWDYSYETRMAASGSIAGGTLDGDLIVVGSGDPSLMEGESSARLFAGWAAALKQRGIQRITGRIVGDHHAFDDEGLGFGWSWDDLPADYAAGVGALQFNENAVRLTVTPGPAVGDSAGIAVDPVTSGLLVRSAMRTGEPNSTPRIETHRLPGSSALELRGSVPAGSAPSVHVVSVDNPTVFFVTALRNALIANGIEVRGPAVDEDAVTDAAARGAGAPLVSFRSPPLSALATRLMKVSQNLYAETLLKTLGASVGPSTAAAGRTTVQSVLTPWGVSDGALIQLDGSGLSRYDYVTAEALVTILTHVDRDERLRGPFEAALPIAGRDGTLSSRMKGTPADGNARAKTGAMANVRALSGYVASADNEPLVFSILANNFDTAPETITMTADAIVVRLAQFRR